MRMTQAQRQVQQAQRQAQQEQRQVQQEQSRRGQRCCCFHVAALRR